jgi:hypothetical protein
MRTGEQAHVEPLLDRLQPIVEQARTGFRLAGGKRLDERLAAGALIEQLHIEAMLGIDALGQAESDGRMAGGHLGPFQLDRNEIAGNGITRRARADYAGTGGHGRHTRRLDEAAARKALGENGFGLLAHLLSPDRLMRTA